MSGLPVSRLIRVSVNLSPLAAARRSFGILMVAGDSDVIDPVERFREYTTIEAVALDFGTNAPEFFAAQLYFGQSPKPNTMYIGRYVRTATSAILKGGILTTAQQLISNFTSITNGGFKVDIDGVEQDILALDFSSETNLNGVASVITAALTDAVCTWNGSRFIITCDSTGVTSEIGFASAPSAGVDISTILKLTSVLALQPVPGFDAETPVECATELAEISSNWYGLTFASSVMPTDDQSVAVAGLIQALGTSRIFGVTATSTLVLEATVTNDIASRLLDLGYTRSFTQYSANPYAICSFFGRAFSVDFNANRSTITMMYKQEPGVVAENLTDTQATTLKNKRCNVFVNYDNNTAIIQYGVMSGPAYFDEIHGLDWFQNAVQNECYNLLYTSKTKIPQTDSGANQIVTAISKVCDEAINNGLAAPGTWNADGFGQIERGSYLKTGYYIFATPIANQSQSQREQRVAPPIQVALKLAGAIQEIDVIVDVNR